MRLLVRGRVQGVGFRPFVSRLARVHELSGWVRNTPEGVVIEVDGPPPRLEAFCLQLVAQPPPLARIDAVIQQPGTPGAHTGAFQILPSQAVAAAGVSVDITPDSAICPACLAEVHDPTSRRHGYALNACTDCGPRFTIQEATPYDRDRTSMRHFTPCADCQRDYTDPENRRHHAQNVACPACGPRLSLIGLDRPPGQRALPPPRDDGAAIDQVVALITRGEVVAVQGLGGFHLLCDATDEHAVAQLRLRKRRPRKPLAVLCRDQAQIERLAWLDTEARRALARPSAPIVVLPRRPDSQLASGIAPGLASVGLMRPYTALHQAIVERAGRPLVATSANASDEPMPIDPARAASELAGITPLLLVHDRPILRHADDSVVRVIGGRAVPLRVGRGLAPVRVLSPRELPAILAVGGHLKAAVAASRGREILLGPHIGNLDTATVRRWYRHCALDFQRLLGITPELVACDLHPDYFTTRYAQEMGLPVVAVQHHHAHVASCLAEHAHAGGPVLGIAFDGTGYGSDGGIWGGEYLVVDGARFERIGSLRPFSLVGGDRAAREPRRCAACVSQEADEPIAEQAFEPRELRLLRAALRAGTRLAAVCTSAGRLFDAWASFLGLCHTIGYEGEAAMLLEEAADPGETGCFDILIPPQDANPGRPRHVVDWRPWVAETARLMKRGRVAQAAAIFHNSLAHASLDLAKRVGLECVVLSGGCFQNKLLSERTEELLTRAGFRVLAHRHVPPGDGGLAVGQLWVAAQGTRIASGGG